jgi:CBS domain-containing protein
MRVKDLMTKQVSTIRAGEPSSAALRLMWDCDCGSLPVLDDDGRVIAVVTDRDIAMTALFRDAWPSALPVSQAMSKNVYFCSPEDSVTSAEEIMRAHQIRRLPVMDVEGRLVGVLSMADIVRRAAGEKGRKKEVIPEEVTALLADACSPRQPRKATYAGGGH